MGIFNRKRKVVAYAVISNNIKNKFLTITKDISSAHEYIMMLLKHQHKTHFEAWCQIRELDVGKSSSWLSYYDDCIDISEKEEFQIIKVKYELENIFAVLRMFGNCIPLGCSFDKEIEEIYFKTVLGERLAQELANKEEKE